MLASAQSNRSIRFRGLLAACFSLALASGCKDDSPTVADPNLDPSPNVDFLTLSENGKTPVMHREASGLPDIDCEPRVDWAASQVVMWDHFSGNGGASGYDLLVDIMFPVVDDVGTYTVHEDFLQAVYYQGETYLANPILAASNGTVIVTRSDSRIEGSYDVTVVDSTQTKSIRLTGTFGIDAGWSLTCP